MEEAGIDVRLAHNIDVRNRREDHFSGNLFTDKQGYNFFILIVNITFLIGSAILLALNDNVKENIG